MNIILKIPDESVLIDDTINVNDTSTNDTNELLNLTNIKQENIIDSISENDVNNIDDTQDKQDNQEIVEENLNDSISNEEINNEIDTTTNCLALIVRENYQVVVVKNFIKKSSKVTWKVVLSIVTLNFLNMFI